MRKEIRFGGFGGQGIISAGNITGKAASIFEDKNAVLIQSYGPEARGGACSADVVIEDEKIDYPQITVPEILILMSQEAYEKYSDDIQDGGIMLLEKDLVEEVERPEGVHQYKIPATKIAEDLGHKIVANVVMLGVLVAVTGAVEKEKMREAILSSVPKGTKDLNEKAFESGLDYGEEIITN
ncbi:2-oxoacid:acceptor oxidoreductase family protein [Candidatus Bipolaricaulota bacterium]|nr:2-oxoacid:acceptor oxidoreductase family protein [Candidatus Bipolaricaulota bacterium]MBS3814156.1 2-oxoacid:acceptor oxidoreductase family protein [Candidatus Bipolaricaulota bacterium]MBS3825153.1 2-oxoacid:acceptor oxidoreductase family protein [Candidatus Bipolaricaulota bacterium]